MKYDDPQRPTSELGATHNPLQTNGSPLPVITLMYPMQNDDGHWGWLATIHAHRGTNRYGTHYAWLRDLAQFSEQYMEDPENALRVYFKYLGPEIVATANMRGTVDEDIF